MRSLSRLLGLTFLGMSLAVAQAAQAVSFYAEILTNDNFPVFPDIRASATLTVDFDPLTFNWSGLSAGPNTGLGAGAVSPGNPLDYTHLFDPTPDAASVLQAWLFISVVDDQIFDAPETATISLDGSFWQTGQATVNLFFDDITALGLITMDGDTIDVRVASLTGDFQVLASALKVKFTEVPEPGTLRLVALGALLLATRRPGAWSRRRR
jgi:hypothetical protein